jgi:hypothetical protein
MGRCRQAALVLIVVAAGIASADGGHASPLRAARWLPADRRLHALAFEPTPCMASDPERTRKLMIGRTAFRTPLLLGGQAARAGLSCNNCHRDGRGNPDFQFRGLSGVPGTADVTSSLMSSHRGDGIENPKPIPDLSGPPERLKVSRDPASRKLESFIHGLITEEFDGPEPSKLTLDSVAAYVRDLSPQACPAATEHRIDLQLYLSDVRAALDATRYALEAHDRATARLMLSGARNALGLINERYAGQELARDRQLLLAADRELAALQDAVDRGAVDAPMRMESWRKRMPHWTWKLERDEHLSLFDPDRLAANLRGDGRP